jgi:NADP-dependent 3-hydroxy acid dehydrogenase YdfG
MAVILAGTVAMVTGASSGIGLRWPRSWPRGDHPAGLLVDGRVADWEQMVRVNLLGALYCAHAAAPAMWP